MGSDTQTCVTTVSTRFPPVTFLEGEELADWDGHDDSSRRIRPVD